MNQSESTDEIVSSAYQVQKKLNIFPRLPHAARFPALATGNVFVFPRWPEVTSFQVLASNFKANFLLGVMIVAVVISVLSPL